MLSFGTLCGAPVGLLEGCSWQSAAPKCLQDSPADILARWTVGGSLPGGLVGLWKARSYFKNSNISDFMNIPYFPLCIYIHMYTAGSFGSCFLLIYWAEVFAGTRMRLPANMSDRRIVEESSIMPLRLWSSFVHLDHK